VLPVSCRRFTWEGFLEQYRDLAGNKTIMVPSKPNLIQRWKLRRTQTKEEGIAPGRKQINVIRLLKAIITFALMFGLFRWFEHRMVYQPYKRMDASSQELGRAVEDLSLPIGRGVRVTGWFFPANPGSPHGHQVVLVSHGNAGNISHRLPLCEALLETGVAVCVFDYRGYGNSTGIPTEEGTYEDARAMQQWLVRRGFSAWQIIAWGESLGGAVAAELARHGEVSGLVLQSSFTSVTDVGREIFPWLPIRSLGSIRYDTLRKLPEINIPLLVLHSKTDSIISYAHGQKLFAAGREPKTFCELVGDHNDPWWINKTSWTNAWMTFLRQL